MWNDNWHTRVRLLEETSYSVIQSTRRKISDFLSTHIDGEGEENLFWEIRKSKSDC
jgi:hypothetical protein